MTGEHSRRPPKLFSVGEAGRYSREELVQTFVPTDTYRQLLTIGNQIILGSRGSGKTTLTKMLAHEYMAASDDRDIKDLIAERTFLGIYVATGTSWVGALRNKGWLEDSPEAEHEFQWRVNLSVCFSFLRTLRSCIATYCPEEQKYELERDIVTEIREVWGCPRNPVSSLDDLHRCLRSIEGTGRSHSRLGDSTNVEQAKGGSVFDRDLFMPLLHAMEVADSLLSLPEAPHWVLCIDEAEFLTTTHHRILNSYMRSGASKLCFKITTLPYHHADCETNLGVPIVPTDDFDYVYIDKDPVMAYSNKRPEESGARCPDFVTSMFHKRASASNYEFEHISLHALLGDSLLLDEPSGFADTEFLAELQSLATEKTYERAQRLYQESRPEYYDQIKRKLSGAILLKKRLMEQRPGSKLDIYSGEKMFIRCSDYSPRRIVQLLGSLLEAIDYQLPTEQESAETPFIKEVVQNEVLEIFSERTLKRAQSVRGVGPLRAGRVGRNLYTLLKLVGRYMKQRFREEKLTTDPIFSIEVPSNVPPGFARLVKIAVAYGFLYPHVKEKDPDPLPRIGEEKAALHFAYALAPYFQLNPRRGKGRNLLSVLGQNHAERLGRGEDDQLQLFGLEGVI